MTDDKPTPKEEVKSFGESIQRQDWEDLKVFESATIKELCEAMQNVIADLNKKQQAGDQQAARDLLGIIKNSRVFLGVVGRRQGVVGAIGEVPSPEDMLFLGVEGYPCEQNTPREDVASAYLQIAKKHDTGRNKDPTAKERFERAVNRLAELLGPTSE